MARDGDGPADGGNGAEHGRGGAISKIYSGEEGLEALLGQTFLKPAATRQLVWECFFVVMPMYMGYATFFGLQHAVKVRLGIADDGSEMSEAFGFAVSFLFIFNMIFRIAHNVVFRSLSSRQRVFVSMGFMVLAMSSLAMPTGLVTSALGPRSLCWAAFSYALGGAAMGTFEPNFLTCLAAMGERTKGVAITGIPVGVSTVLILGFTLMGPPLRIPSQAVYVCVGVLVLCGAMILAVRVPDPGASATASGLPPTLMEDLRQVRAWLPLMWTQALAFTLDMAVLSCFCPGVALYIYDRDTVSITEHWEVPTQSFFAVLNTASLLGSVLGRRVSYSSTPRHPGPFVVFSLVGAALLLAKIPVLAAASTFFVMLGDGLIYGHLARHVDKHVPAEFNLIATSCWCLMGDVGAVVGTNSVSFVRAWVGGS